MEIWAEPRAWGSAGLAQTFLHAPLALSASLQRAQHPSRLRLLCHCEVYEVYCSEGTVQACCEAVVQSGRLMFLISLKSGLKFGPAPPCLSGLGAGPNFVFTQNSPAEFGSELRSTSVPHRFCSSLESALYRWHLFLKICSEGGAGDLQKPRGALLLP